MEGLRRYVQSASRLYSVELAIFLLACYAILFGISLAMLSRGAMAHSIIGMFTAGFFAILSLTFLFIEAQVVRAIANHGIDG
jgi:hypothetical protein